MVIVGLAICAQKMMAIKLEAATYDGVELGGRQIAGYSAQSAKIKSSVKIIDPMLRCRFAILPGTIGLLPICRIASNLQRGNKKLILVGVAVCPAQQCGRKEVCVVNLVAYRGQGIA